MLRRVVQLLVLFLESVPSSGLCVLWVGPPVLCCRLVLPRLCWWLPLSVLRCWSPVLQWLCWGVPPPVHTTFLLTGLMSGRFVRMAVASLPIPGPVLLGRHRLGQVLVEQRRFAMPVQAASRYRHTGYRQV